MLYVILYLIIGLLLIPITAFLLKHEILTVGTSKNGLDTNILAVSLFFLWPIVIIDFIIVIIFVIFGYIGKWMTNYINGE